MAARSAVHCGLRHSAMAAPRQRAVGWARWACTAAAPRSWRLFGAMCLLRLPRITQPLEKEEEEMAALMGQVERAVGGMLLLQAWRGEHTVGLAGGYGLGGDSSPAQPVWCTLGDVVSRREAIVSALCETWVLWGLIVLP